MKVLEKEENTEKLINDLDSEKLGFNAEKLQIVAIQQNPSHNVTLIHQH